MNYLDSVKNFALAIVDGTYDSSATTINLLAGHGVKFPNPSTDGAFNAVWWNSGSYGDPSLDPNAEVVRVTARSTDTLTIIRAQEGTNATNKNLVGASYSLLLGITKKMIEDIDTTLFGKIPTTYLDTDVTLAANSDTKLATQKAVKTYADGLVAGLLDYRGVYDASGNVYPSTGGSGVGGAITKGDMWLISVAGTLGGVAIQIGDSIIANTDSPGQTSSNWNALNTNISYTPENITNKVTSISGSSTDVQYPSAKLLYDQLALKANLISPSFTTPALGVATATSLAIGGATIGTNALAVNGTSYFNGNATFAGSVSATFVSSVYAKFNPYTTAGSSATPVYEDAIQLGTSANLAKIQYGNSFSVNNGSFIRFIVNSTANTNTPITVLTLEPSANATFAGSVLHPNGSATAPSISFSGDTNTGLYSVGADQIGIAVNGASMVTVTTTGVGIGTTTPSLTCTISSTGTFGWDNGSGTGDVILRREAANTLALRNSTNAQTFNIYNTYTDASNYERAIFNWSSNIFYFGTSQAGTGTARQMNIVVNGASRFGFTTGGHLIPITDNVSDLGSSSYKIRTGYFGTSVQTASLNLTGIQDISSSSYAVLATDSLVKCNALSNVITVTLPSAVTSAGKLLVIKKTDVSSNIVTINTTSSQTINGELNQYLYDQHDALLIISDGANWHLS